MIFKIDRFPTNNPQYIVVPPIAIEHIKKDGKYFVSCQSLGVKSEGENEEDVYKRFYKQLSLHNTVTKIGKETKEDISQHECEYCIKSATSKCEYCHKYRCDLCFCDCYIIPPE